jgi:hypothetical protein
MNKIFNSQTYIFLFSFIMLRLTKAISFTQDSAASAGSSTRTTTTTTQHATAIPGWVWIVGGVTRNRDGDAGRTDKVTYTKTTSSDSNT